MATLLLAERAPEHARILVIGAGGGMEISAMARAQSQWSFVGADPSTPMLDLARAAVKSVANRVKFIEGVVDQVGESEFDGATCLLTLHFLDRAERMRTLQEIRRRLKPNARLIVAHHAPPAENAEQWMIRSAAFGNRTGAEISSVEATGKLMVQRLPLLAPSDEESLLREAGFEDVELFYAAFSFRGWVATAM
jgi:tRNA (cmo5U34)-methyltransferase